MFCATITAVNKIQYYYYLKQKCQKKRKINETENIHDLNNFVSKCFYDK